MTALTESADGISVSTTISVGLSDSAVVAAAMK